MQLTGSKTRLATHLPGLCWGCRADGLQHALGSYVQIQADDCAVAAPGTDARKFTSSAGTPTVLVAICYYWSTSVRKLWQLGMVSTSAEGLELVAGYSVSATGLTIGRLSMGRLVEYLGAVRTVDFS